MSVERATDASFWRGEAEDQNRAAVRALFAAGKTNGELQPGGRAFCKHSWARRIAREAGKSLPLRATSEARSVPRWPVVPRDPGEHLMKDCRPIRSVWPSRDASCYLRFLPPEPSVSKRSRFQRKHGIDAPHLLRLLCMSSWGGFPVLELSIADGGSACGKDTFGDGHFLTWCASRAAKPRLSAELAAAMEVFCIQSSDQITRMHACGLWFLLPVSLALRLLEPRALAFGFPPFRKIIYGCGNACNEP